MGFPSLLLKRLYTDGSLANEPHGFHFAIKNRLMDVTLTCIQRLQVDGKDIPLDTLEVELTNGHTLRAAEVTPERPAPFAVRDTAVLRAHAPPLPTGAHEIRLAVDTRPYGTLEVTAKDAITAGAATPDGPQPVHIPYDPDPAKSNSPELVRARQRFAQERTGATLRHVSSFSIDPQTVAGNCENFLGVAQVPIGLAGPLRINGEHAKGEFFIPLATTEGTLVASYSRGMKVLNLAGGVTCTVVDSAMQRAPVFVLDSAREAREFRDWIRAHLPEIRVAAEATSHVAKLVQIESYLASKLAFLRFDFTTGDAAGQNMVSRATFAACTWILDHAPGIRHFYLESNLATDKKSSHVNVMRTRGKRVTAEATIPARVMRDVLRVEPEMLTYHAGVANVGAIISGANNNGLHSVNGITAMFIATGQDVANVSEGTAAIGYTELTPAGDLYLSITIPSLIVATHGGGTKLGTQQECLALLGCTGPGTVDKLAEIVAGVVLAGEISLAGAISSLEWVSAHEQYGRNR